ncbi:hypothetical protein A3F07_03555 [candidate division WWE3 bacterium RIFCSPHIGHO2_12_FULL_38_15]|uniref:Uncharacterized protein n=1 Tax=candidate division WWE3 bacterium RIFCSPHIGHO2_02_FULL_38_14 TaxID=1802620 RepID=A0A1F4V794_UNCKA|nr:MAG: hypothetical protein A2793_02825 [candidate division WWE3 bacterium RIFCSPHIGHO2_01_FULL_38_45]OGC48874.1 MAG: hypothetical protein A3F07_03555 [candidate division WWE3 bacterium RIFCSPHIGHO2_12_FULL_38_15]OGC53021.1 MAG: hypothetical protein A3D91_01785 [candidate division WWE3 bacterium RIFCSPHIGHO2_02_FULL_38_14]OGC53177.1 MAG: hypothetical protein A3B64_01895 [candidate division WWE3 bacterium RIFCSPLOWO2_01_FULL_37_24]HLB52022.1 DUF4406 domain-containing protein [Patescibacteria gr
MRKTISSAVKKATSLDAVKKSLFDVFKDFRKQGFERIGYVSGTITSDGEASIPKNIERLTKFTDHVRTIYIFPIFSATDVFDDILFARLFAAGFRNENWMVFWKEVLSAKEKFITDIFMTPKWEKSRGAADEHKTAKKMRITINYIEYEI